MQLQDLFDTQAVMLLLTQHRVIMYQGDSDYPLLFFVYVMRYMKKVSGLAIEIVDFSDVDLHEVQVKFETSFLGMQTIFWLRLPEDDKKRKKLLSYITAYQGPNILMVWVGNHTLQEYNNIGIVEIPSQVNARMFSAMLQWLEIKLSSPAQAMIGRLYKRHASIALDSACMVINYACVLASGHQNTLDEWIDTIINSEKSLFGLGTTFFARQPKQFFALWSCLHDQYSPLFWISFWSEQLWRAAQFVHLASKNNMPEARKIGYRLPFSFMQKDWKLVTEQELTTAHQMLYSTDFALKNGAQAPLLELLYTKFFERSLV